MNISKNAVIRLLSPSRDTSANLRAPPVCPLPPPAAAGLPSAVPPLTPLPLLPAAADTIPPPHQMQANNNQQTNLLTELAEHIPREQWFSLIQDQGIEMTELELITYSDGGRKCKTRNIAHGGFFYKELYKLAELLFTFMDHHHDEKHQPFIKLANVLLPEGLFFSVQTCTLARIKALVISFNYQLTIMHPDCTSFRKQLLLTLMNLKMRR